MAVVEGMFDMEWDMNVSDLVFDKEPFAKGAFGYVIKADYLGLPVCVKVLQKTSEEQLEKFILREVAALKTLSHPNLVQFIGVTERDNNIYLVTEYVPGGTLRKHLKNADEEIAWPIRIQIASDIASAMAFLHSRKIIHRDLKSKNLLVSDNWKVKLCDFGFARSIKDVKAKRHMTLCGTEEYMAPEVIFGNSYDEYADVFSYGLILCELIMRRKVEETVPRSPDMNFSLDFSAFRSLAPPECPPLFLELAFVCAEYDPKNRPGFRDITKILRTVKESMQSPTPVKTPAVKIVVQQEKPSVDAGSPRNPRDMAKRGTFGVVPDDVQKDINDLDSGLPPPPSLSSLPPPPPPLSPSGGSTFSTQPRTPSPSLSPSLSLNGADDQIEPIDRAASPTPQAGAARKNAPSTPANFQTANPNPAKQKPAAAPPANGKALSPNIPDRPPLSTRPPPAKPASSATLPAHRPALGVPGGPPPKAMYNTIAAPSMTNPPTSKFVPKKPPAFSPSDPSKSGGETPATASAGKPTFPEPVPASPPDPAKSGGAAGSKAPPAPRPIPAKPSAAAVPSKPAPPPRSGRPTLPGQAPEATAKPGPAPVIYRKKPAAAVST